MALVNFSNLDFDQIKSSLKEYLRANSNFTDYDFEGSNLSTIIDTLAYNTYITSYNANMVSNEVFIDSATLRENVVSLARAIGYSRIVSVYPDGAIIGLTDEAGVESEYILDGSYIAAALAGLNVSTAYDVAEPMTRKTITGFKRLIRDLDEVEMDETDIVWCDNN
jgi:hypothetical protein